MRRKRFWIIVIFCILMTPACGGISALEETSKPTVTPIATTDPALTTISDGTWLVGEEVPAGIYSAPGGDECSWKRRSGFSGTSDDTIAGDFGVVRPVVEIAPTDKGFTTSDCGQWTLVKSVSTPMPTPTLTPTKKPAPKPVVSIPQGWQPISSERLGYSLAVPRGWLIFDLQSGQLGQFIGSLGDPAAAAQLQEFLDSPEGQNAGHLAVELNIFAQPPFSSLAGVYTFPLSDDISQEQVKEYVAGAIESVDMDYVKLQSLEIGTINNLPSIQGVGTVDLSSADFDFNAHVVITALRANDTAYILLLVTWANVAKGKQPLIDQIVGTFRSNIPAPISEPAGVVKPGTYLVGIDIQPATYVGHTGTGIGDFCYWERLKDLTGKFNSILANDNSIGLFYVEILPSDKAFMTRCELKHIDQVPAPDKFLTNLLPGMYIVHRDIAPGLYRGQAPQGDSCYWERLRNALGVFSDILANDNAEGRYFVEVLPSDFAVRFRCPVEKVR